MKKILSLALFFILCIPVLVFAQDEHISWQELETFHSFMSSTFHPTEEGDFLPLKEKADSLLIAAKLWQASPVPADYKSAKTKKTLAKLVIQCTRIQKAVQKNAKDKELKKLITNAHDIFHTIVGECKKTE